MLIDGRTIAQGQILRADICIVGAGPGGLALARDLVGRGVDVLLVESGGFEPDDQTQSLASGTVEDNLDQYPDPYWSCNRMVGGTSQQWDVIREGKQHVHLGAFDPMDFTRRSWLPHSGWPIDAQTLAPYYERAHGICDTRFREAPLQDWETPDRQAFRFADGTLYNRVFAIGRRAVFTEEIRAVLEKDPRVNLLIWSNVTELETDADGGRVTAAKIACLNGHRFRVEARQFVLSQGAYQVPRLLLASRAAHTAALGNAHDQVGRYLTDRQVIRTGVLDLARPMADFGFYDIRAAINQALVIGKLGVSPEIIEREQLLNAMMGLFARPHDRKTDIAERLYGRGTTYRSPGQQALKQLGAGIKQRRWPQNAFGNVARVLRNLDDIAFTRVARRLHVKNPYNADSGGWFERPDRDQIYSQVETYQIGEQSPDPDNRVMLDPARRDATGMPLLKLRLQWNAIDIRSATRTQDLVAQAFSAAGIGKLRVERRDGVPLVSQINTHHPAGTARMSSDPKHGVVDAQCRVHGVANLYVASSAAFTTGGCVPPTLTIIALALRIGDAAVEALKPTRVVPSGAA